MPEMQHIWHIGWFWFFVGIGIICLGSLPILFGGRYHLSYLAGLSIGGLLFVCAFAWRGMYSLDQANISGIASRTTDAVEGFSLSFASGAGGMELAFIDSHDMHSEALTHKLNGPSILWYPGSQPKYPEEMGWPSLFKRGGFQLMLVNEPDRPNRNANRHRWMFVFPAYFPVPFLLIFPYLYLRRRILIPRHRRKHNLCLACGYSRQGLSIDSKCPECGKANPTPTSSPSAQPPSASSAK